MLRKMFRQSEKASEQNPRNASNDGRAKENPTETRLSKSGNKEVPPRDDILRANSLDHRASQIPRQMMERERREGDANQRREGAYENLLKNLNSLRVENLNDMSYYTRQAQNVEVETRKLSMDQQQQVHRKFMELFSKRSTYRGEPVRDAYAKQFYPAELRKIEDWVKNQKPEQGEKEQRYQAFLGSIPEADKAWREDYSFKYNYDKYESLVSDTLAKTSQESFSFIEQYDANRALLKEIPENIHPAVTRRIFNHEFDRIATATQELIETSQTWDQAQRMEEYPKYLNRLPEEYRPTEAKEIYGTETTRKLASTKDLYFDNQVTALKEFNNRIPEEYRAPHAETILKKVEAILKEQDAARLRNRANELLGEKQASHREGEGPQEYKGPLISKENLAHRRAEEAKKTPLIEKYNAEQRDSTRKGAGSLPDFKQIGLISRRDAEWRRRKAEEARRKAEETSQVRDDIVRNYIVGKEYPDWAAALNK
ncbi:hypothetical protein ccbrp13_48450 [Ktedonobacteria bacterium brp13]|nr:hypothetical protein ccbrp13_48450 [Ktedonobacteria bacterium brp13]